MEPFILASGSPRRQAILKEMGIPFKVIIPQIDESIIKNIKAEQIPESLAKQKIDYVYQTVPETQSLPWILSADTLMIMDNKVYGKPVDVDQAVQFLKDFSDKTHCVITGIALYNGKTHKTITRSSKTYVTFAPLSSEEIDWYISTGDWHNVAGGYRIQGVGSYFIKRIEGTYSNVVGLPLFELYDMLKEQNYPLLNNKS